VVADRNRAAGEVEHRLFKRCQRSMSISFVDPSSGSTSPPTTQLAAVNDLLDPFSHECTTSLACTIREERACDAALEREVLLHPGNSKAR
jgi:hypothetical protein